MQFQWYLEFPVKNDTLSKNHSEVLGFNTDFRVITLTEHLHFYSKDIFTYLIDLQIQDNII